MGEYVMHPDALDEHPIKIGVMRGEDPANWSTWWPKDFLIELRSLGYKTWYGDRFSDFDALDAFIKQYDACDTNLAATSFCEVDMGPGDNPQILSILYDAFIDEGIDSVVILRNKRKILVCDKRSSARARDIGAAVGAGYQNFIPYEFASKSQLSFESLMDRLRKNGGFKESSLSNMAPTPTYCNVYAYSDIQNVLGYFLVDVKEGIAILPYREVSLGDGWEKIVPELCRVARKDDILEFRQALEYYRQTSLDLSLMIDKLSK